jgi:hypothetical protein
LLSKLIHSQTPYTLIVTPEISELQDVESRLEQYDSLNILPMGKELSAHLSTIPPKDWGRETRNWMTTQCRETPAEILVCSQIDLLFEPSLSLDPLALFQSLSRTKRLLVLWPGRIQDGRLSYAVPEHAHYRTWQQPVAPIFDWQAQHMYY